MPRRQRIIRMNESESQRRIRMDRRNELARLRRQRSRAAQIRSNIEQQQPMHTDDNGPSIVAENVQSTSSNIIESPGILRRPRYQNESESQRRIRLDRRNELARLSRQRSRAAQIQSNIEQQEQSQRRIRMDRRNELARLRRQRSRAAQIRSNIEQQQPMQTDDNGPSIVAENVQSSTINQDEPVPIRTNNRIENIVSRHAMIDRQQRSAWKFDNSVLESNWQTYLHNLGPMDQTCQYCSANYFLHENQSSCCRGGKIRPPHDYRNYPEFLKKLLSDPSAVDYKHFQDKIRSYNAAIAMASLGANHCGPIQGRGPFCFKIMGQIYHSTSNLYPTNSQDQRSFGQLYIFDGHEAVEHRLRLAPNRQCKEYILSKLVDMMVNINPYAQSFRLLHSLVQGQTNLPEIHLEFINNRTTDIRRYNEPRCTEVAIIFETRDGLPQAERNLQIYPKSGHNCVNLCSRSPHCDPMTYPIFFPNGQQGWHQNMPYDPFPNVNLPQTRGSITLLQYYSAQMAIRAEIFSPILHGGRLFQQWCCDCYMRIEENNLNYLRLNQNQLRTELYSGLGDYVRRMADNQEELPPPGKICILPSSFVGSPRYMHQAYQDSMAIVTAFGKPDLFITFTCNSNWPEIKNNLLPGQEPSDRPDLISRVFSLKTKQLIEDIVAKQLFGPVSGYCYTIEFQKRGLPHMHLLIILHNSYKIHEVDHIDKFIKAELPNPNIHPQLYERVKSFMIHNPCGLLNPASPCMVDGKCSKQYPKDYQQATEFNRSGWPLYQRSENGSSFIQNQIEIDNRWVVPYNPFLLMKFNAHINVEACCSIHAIKYLYKYIHKGHDSALIRLQQNGTTMYDEIQNYVDTRYVSSCEATYRIQSQKLLDRSHVIQRLPVHLPDEQSVVFAAGQEEMALARAAIRKTKLIGWFELNQINSTARSLKYAEVPHFFTWSQSNHCWNSRQNHHSSLTRLYVVSPRHAERFALRLLLLNVKGATSFEFLRTFNGILYPSFQEAARKRGLLSSDEEIEECLQEAVAIETPKNLRSIFAYLLIFNGAEVLQNANDIWIKFKESFSEDFVRQYQTIIEDENLAKERAEQRALLEIKTILQQHSYNLNTFSLPEISISPELLLDDNSIRIEEYRLEAELLCQKLNAAQRAAFDEIMNPTGSKCFFLDGPGGSGKTFLYNAIIKTIKGSGKDVLAFATTGIASLLLEGGRTVHSGLKLPLDVNESSVAGIKPSSRQAEEIRKCEIIIIDEVTMMTVHILNCIDRLLKDVIQDINQPFGGKKILIGGDFRQTLPIVPHATNPAEIIEICINRSSIWNHFKKLTLIDNMRLQTNSEFNEWLLKIGAGTTPAIAGLHSNMVEIPSSMICVGDLISQIFGNFTDTDDLANRIILTATNEMADKINMRILGYLPGEERTYRSIDTHIFEDEDENEQAGIQVEFLNSLSTGGMPPHELKLKLGSVVILLRNLDHRKGLCNGTRLQIVRMQQKSITAKILSGVNHGELVCLPRINLTTKKGLYPFILKRKQFPIRLAYAMTINKSQGQTFNAVGIHLNKRLFGHGQLYVALSRCRNPNNIKILIEEADITQGDVLKNGRHYITNIVYPGIV